MFRSLLQVTDDRTHCHFMAPSVTLKVEICERISREYISHQTWRSHPNCDEFYGGSNSHPLEYMCTSMCVLPRRRGRQSERDEIKVTINLMNGTTFSAESVVPQDSWVSVRPPVQICSLNSRLNYSCQRHLISFYGVPDSFKDYALELHSTLPFGSVI